MSLSKLSSGIHMGSKYFIAYNQKDAIDALTNETSIKHLYVVKAAPPSKSIEIYPNLKTVPNGISRFGKLYEGASLKKAIIEIKKHQF